jgi:hypothetical protein
MKIEFTALALLLDNFLKIEIETCIAKFKFKRYIFFSGNYSSSSINGDKNS